MKNKNTISFSGPVYTITTANKRILNEYLELIKSYVGDKQFNLEINYRIDELLGLYGLKEQSSITLKHIKNIKQKLGDPSDFSLEPDQVYDDIVLKFNTTKTIFRYACVILLIIISFLLVYALISTALSLFATVYSGPSYWQLFRERYTPSDIFGYGLLLVAYSLPATSSLLTAYKFYFHKIVSRKLMLFLFLTYIVSITLIVLKLSLIQ